jgi:hypothetical protein
MTDIAELQVFLTAKAKEDKPKAEIDFELKKNKWLKNIGEFYDRIIDWLKPLADKGILSYEKTPNKIEEEPIGVYEVDNLTIHIGNQNVTFYPKGALIIGAEGRIDIRGRRAIRSIVLNNNEWSLVERSPRIKLAPFNELSFRDVLSEVME